VNEKADHTNERGPASTSSFPWSPSGLDLNPRPPRPVRVSKRASGLVLLLVAGVLGLFAYGGYKRQQRQVAALAESGASRNVSPATAAGADIAKDVPTGSVPVTGRAGIQPPGQASDLRPPEDGRSPANSADRVVVRQPSPPPAPQNQLVREPSPEERRLAQAYQQEQDAIAAPTSVRDSFAPTAGGARATSNGAPVAATDASDAIASLVRSLGNGHAPATLRGTGDTSFEGQDAKEAFLAKARAGAAGDYLKSTRTAPLSQFEIKAGWEIPAVLEQALNSDLPGELKALVTSNVYDTATGWFLLIPQGSRLVGVYDSRIGYGQDGAQVIWDRIIFPDASSLDLGGMIGQDSRGFSGFREKVDRHYRRLIGFAVLTSLFSASAEVAQSRNRTLLTYPSPGEVAASAAGQEVSEVGAQITRRNLNVQPTIKIPIGYKFNVRVNRDIVFEAPYRPLL
jgi:type IV secretion system protein VirB10